MTQELKQLEQEYQKEIKDMPSGVLMTFYMLAKHHERYRLTGWILNELVLRGFDKDEINNTEEAMEKSYLDILNSEFL